MSKKTKIGILGIGAVGGYFGGLLAEKYLNSKNVEIIFIARERSANIIKEKGLKIITPTEERIVFPSLTTSNPKDIGELDLHVFDRLGLRVERHRVLLIEVERTDIVEPVQVVGVNMSQQDRVEPRFFRKIAQRLLPQVGGRTDQDRRAPASERLDQDRSAQPVVLRIAQAFLHLGAMLHADHRHTHAGAAAKHGDEELPGFFRFAFLRGGHRQNATWPPGFLQAAMCR